MIDERFSVEAFKRCGLDTENAQQLADILTDEIQQELRLVIEMSMTRFVQKLNEMGHNLVLYNELCSSG